MSYNDEFYRIPEQDETELTQWEKTIGAILAVNHGVASLGKKIGVKERIQDACACANFINKTVEDPDNETRDGAARVGIDELDDTTGMLEIDTSKFQITNVPEFCKCFSKASTMEFMPLKNGKIRCGFTFVDMIAIVFDDRKNGGEKK